MLHMLSYVHNLLTIADYKIFQNFLEFEGTSCIIIYVTLLSILLLYIGVDKRENIQTFF